MTIETKEKKATGASRDTAQPMESLTLTARSLKESGFLRRLSQAMERHDEETAILEFRHMLFDCQFMSITTKSKE